MYIHVHVNTCTFLLTHVKRDRCFQTSHPENIVGNVIVKSLCRVSRGEEVIVGIGFVRKILAFVNI